MIKNVVFDLGNVLVDFTPNEYLEALGYTGEIKDTLMKIIFNGNEWREYDRGFYLHNTDLQAKLISDHPEYAKDIQRIIDNDWVKTHILKDDTVEFLKDVKTDGKRVFILSNLSIDSYEFITKMDFFKLVDGGVYSYQIMCCKPDKGIYDELINKYHLIPDETVFFDDRYENIEAANKLGIHGIQFLDISQAKADYYKIG